MRVRGQYMSQDATQVQLTQIIHREYDCCGDILNSWIEWITTQQGDVDEQNTDVSHGYYFYKPPLKVYVEIRVDNFKVVFSFENGGLSTSICYYCNIRI